MSLVLLSVSVSVFSAGYADVATPPIRVRSPAEPSYRVLLRSLVYPGWGQLHNSKHLKAVLIFASETALLGMVYRESREASEAYDAHLVAADKTVAARLYEDYERHFDRRESLIWWTVGLVLFSLADAYVDANLVTFEEEFDEEREESRISLKTRQSPGGGFISLQYVF